jgi:hypothetical protein
MKHAAAITLVLAAALAAPALAGAGGIDAIKEKYGGPGPGSPAPGAAPLRTEGAWAVYANGRFGTTVDYPPALFTPLPAPENGDGRAFQTADGQAGFVAWGGFNVMGDTAASRLGTYLESAGFDEIDELSMIGTAGFRIVATRAGARMLHAEIIDGDVIHGFEAEIGPGADPDLAAVMRRIMESLRGPDANGAAGTDAPPLPQGYHTPAAGTPARSAMLDAARAAITPQIGQPIAFSVETLRSDGAWAYLAAVPVQPDGRPLDWLTTPFADGWRNDMMSDLVMVLLHDDGSGWRALDWVIGPTDVYWIGWMQDYGLPEALFFER